MITLKDFYQTMTYFSIEQKETAIAMVEAMEKSPEGILDLIKLLDGWIVNCSSEILKMKFVEIRNNYEIKNTIVTAMEEISND